MTGIKKRTLSKGSQFFCGGLIYGALELCWRGFTHISMLILGGICFCVLCSLSKTRRCLFVKALAGGIFITAAEFLTGCVVNIWMRLGVWDYRGETIQLCGQICARYFLLWCALSAAVIPLCQFVRTRGPVFLAQLPLLRRRYPAFGESASGLEGFVPGSGDPAPLFPEV